MSLDYHVYVGPFLRCKVGEREVPIEIYGCQDCQSSTTAEKKFCYECGKPLETYAKTSRIDTVNDFELAEQIAHSLYCRDIEKGYHFWFGNKKDGCGYSLDMDDMGNGCKEMNKDIMECELLVFAKFYENEINTIADAYGEENVEMLWGVVHTVS